MVAAEAAGEESCLECAQLTPEAKSWRARIRCSRTRSFTAMAPTCWRWPQAPLFPHQGQYPGKRVPFELAYGTDGRPGIRELLLVSGQVVPATPITRETTAGNTRHVGSQERSLCPLWASPTRFDPGSTRADGCAGRSARPSGQFGQLAGPAPALPYRRSGLSPRQ